MMSFFTSTARRSFRGLVSSSTVRPKTLFGTNNTNASLLCTGHRFLSSSTGRRKSVAETSAKDSFTPPPPPSTPEEQEELKKLYEEMHKIRDSLASEFGPTGAFDFKKLPDLDKLDFLDDDDAELTEEQKAISEKMDEMFLNNFNVPPQLMKDLFNETNPLKVDLAKLWVERNNEKDLAANEYINEEGDLDTFHPLHTLNEQNSYIDDDGDRVHVSELEAEDLYDEEGEIIPERHDLFLAANKILPDYYDKKWNYSRVTEQEAWADLKLAADELRALETHDMENEAIRKMLEEEVARMNENDENENDDEDSEKALAQSEKEEGAKLMKALEKDEEEDDNVEVEDPEDPSAIDKYGLTTEERELLEEEIFPDEPGMREVFVEDIMRDWAKDEEDDATHIALESEGSEDATDAQKDDEYTDDGTFELNPVVTNRKMVVGNDSASSDANTKSASWNQEQAQEINKLMGGFSETLLRSLTDPNFRPEVSPLVKKTEKGPSSKKGSSGSPSGSTKKP